MVGVVIANLIVIHIVGPSKKTAVIGPLGDDQHDMLGPWWGRGDDNDVVSLLTGVREQSPGATFAQVSARHVSSSRRTW